MPPVRAAPRLRTASVVIGGELRRRLYQTLRSDAQAPVTTVTAVPGGAPGSSIRSSLTVNNHHLLDLGSYHFVITTHGMDEHPVSTSAVATITGSSRGQQLRRRRHQSGRGGVLALDETVDPSTCIPGLTTLSAGIMAITGSMPTTAEATPRTLTPGSPAGAGRLRPVDGQRRAGRACIQMSIQCDPSGRVQLSVRIRRRVQRSGLFDGQRDHRGWICPITTRRARRPGATSGIAAAQRRLRGHPNRGIQYAKQL